ncbi:MAG: sulfite exporter TauE/SafE family protein [Flavobacteriaceae bacterium]|nr:sulfite exporter TauE/SafE family protein [Flavobacteriaceae bacterium]
MIEFSELLQVAIDNWGIVVLFFLVAILYSSVGFGGGSSYLAILALTGMGFIQFRAISLLCNIVVVSGGTYIYFKKGLFNWKKITPLALLSVPFAFLGGYLKISQTFFFVLLGFTLIVAALSMWVSKYIVDSPKQGTYKSVVKDGFLGGVIGFVSGMVGIGGGIFLAPLLHLTNWDTPKRIAATASFFILVNSIAGLLGQYQSRSIGTDFYFEPNIAFILILAVFFGGQIGSRLSASKISPYVLKRITAVLIAFVGLRILYKYLL